MSDSAQASSYKDFFEGSATLDAIFSAPIYMRVSTDSVGLAGSMLSSIAFLSWIMYKRCTPVNEEYISSFKVGVQFLAEISQKSQKRIPIHEPPPGSDFLPCSQFVDSIGILIQTDLFRWSLYPRQSGPFY